MINKKRKHLIEGILLVALIGIAISLYFKKNYFDTMSLQRLELLDEQGNKVTPEDLEGKPVVLAFWATWCPSCRKELPDFEAVSRELGDQVQFVLVSDESMEVIQAFTEKNDYQFSPYHSEKDLLFYGIRTIPRTFFFNAQGKLVAEAQKSINKEELLDYLDQIN